MDLAILKLVVDMFCDGNMERRFIMLTFEDVARSYNCETSDGNACNECLIPK